MTPLRLRPIVCLSALLALVLVAPRGRAQSPGTSTEPGSVPTPAGGAIGPGGNSAGNGAGNGNGGRRVTVYVTLEGEPAAAVAAGIPRGPQLAARAPQARARVADLHARQAALQQRLPALGAQVTGRFTRVANALRLRIPEDQLEALAQLPGVRRVERARLHSRHLGVSVPFVGAPAAWAGAGAEGGLDGRGLRIGIIDSGIDYTHADFGGSGRVADFTANDPTRIEPGSFPTARVVGGFDFAGDAYNPGDEAHETPLPDPDPLDCAGNAHGTHVAGIAAGGGVLLDGTPYTGEYGPGLDPARFRVAPGVAPRASLVALKVFGCQGSTLLVTDALEWAADPDGDFDFSDRLDVVNLSLGSEFGTLDPEDTDLAAANRLAGLGCVVVCSAGNSGNSFFAVGTPGVAPRALSVANSISKGLGGALQVLEPASVAGLYYQVEAAITPSLTNTGPVSGRLVAFQPGLACDAPLNAQALRGAIALIDRGTCLFSEKILRAQDAGAIAVVMVNNQDSAPIPMGGDGAGLRIPAVMVSRADGARLKGPPDGTVLLQLDASLQIERSEFLDTLDDDSSRGPASPGGLLKPDLGAPGSNLVSAKAGSGTDGMPLTGTSMASPMVAGAAALLRQHHRDWTVEDLKAALMNTTRPISNPSGIPYPESRMGAGRLQVAEAVRTDVVAVGESEDGRVGVAFGALSLGSTRAVSRTVILRNHGSAPATFRVAFSNTLAQAGIRFEPADATVTVPARGTASTVLRLRADPEGLDPRPDATTPPTQGAGTLLPRHYLYEASGQLWFHPVATADGPAAPPPLHLPCHASIQAATESVAESPTFRIPAGRSAEALPELTLRFVGQAASTNLLPLVSAFQLGETSPDKHLADPNRAAADLVAVGVATDRASVASFEDSSVYFGIATAGAWSTPQPAVAAFEVLVDVNGDGWEDFLVYNDNASATNTSGALDAFMSVVFELGPSFEILSTNAVAYLNSYAADELDTAPFHNSVLVLPVPVWAIGLDDRRTTFRYKVLTRAPSGSVDRTAWIPFDAARPVVDTAYSSPDGLPYHDDGFPVKVRLDREAAQLAGQRLPGVLFLHHHGQPGRRAEIVTLDLALDDTDGDRLPDWWEQARFNGLAVAGPGTDSDGDGAPDAHEWQSGTDPRNPQSLFRMQSATRVSARNITVRWTGPADARFTLERSTNLTHGFTKVVRENITSTPPLNSLTDTDTAGPGPYYYRVRMQ